MFDIAHSYLTTEFFSCLTEMKEKPPAIERNPNEFVYETPHTKTIIIYKENFVPFTTRIYNFITSFSGSSENGDK